MSLNEQIEKDYIAAYKNKDQIKLSVLRLLKTAAKNKLVELCRTHETLSDSELMDVIIKQAKQRQDSIEQYLQAQRPDLAEREKEELLVLEAYLPQKMGEEELGAAIDEAIRATGASSPREMGKVMKYMMDKYKGSVDGKLLSDEVKKRLNS